MNDFLSELSAGKINKNRNITPLFLEYEEPIINRSEILRYAGYPASVLRAKYENDGDFHIFNKLANRCEKCQIKCDMSMCKGNIDDNYSTAMPDESDSELQSLLSDTILSMKKELTYRISYVTYALEFDNEGYPILPFTQRSEDLKKNLEGCIGVVIFVATIGAGIDRLIRRYERTRPAKGLLLQGAGAERVEALCDIFCDDVEKNARAVGLNTRPRYSPGYGDLPITVQPQILMLVNAQKRLGITLNSSYLMSPSKSVSAIIGICK